MDWGVNHPCLVECMSSNPSCVDLFPWQSMNRLIQTLLFTYGWNTALNPAWNKQQTKLFHPSLNITIQTVAGTIGVTLLSNIIWTIFEIKNTTLLDFLWRLWGLFFLDFGLENVKTERVRDTTVRVTWDHAPSCYERTAILVSYEWDSGASDPVKVFKDAKSHDITGLEPGTKYRVSVTAEYGDIKSVPKLSSFTTCKFYSDFGLNVSTHT